MKELLQTDLHFPTPIYFIEKPLWLDKALEASKPLLAKARESKKKDLLEREIILGKDTYEKVKDHGYSYHSENFFNNPLLKDMTGYILQTSHNLLDEWGFEANRYKLTFSEFWVQEFSHNGGGHHDTHIHWNNHISGFYFLQCSEKTSYPIFHDPRQGSMMTKLQPKQTNEILMGGPSVQYKKIKPGTLVFFPSYLPHQFTVDDGIEPFSFIHFNIQAIDRNLVEQINDNSRIR
jgi:uncharacterized protein (TIGR02466 family)